MSARVLLHHMALTAFRDISALVSIAFFLVKHPLYNHRWDPMGAILSLQTFWGVANNLFIIPILLNIGIIGDRSAVIRLTVLVLLGLRTIPTCLLLYLIYPRARGSKVIRFGLEPRMKLL
jgi:hypothetical protein